MSSLKFLTLDNNLLKEIPIEIFRYLRLEFLSIENNLISDLPPEICEWRECLFHLNISKNRIFVF